MAQSASEVSNFIYCGERERTKRGESVRGDSGAGRRKQGDTEWQ